MVVGAQHIHAKAHIPVVLFQYFPHKKKNDFERGFLKSFDMFYGEALAVVKLQKEELEKAKNDD